MRFVQFYLLTFDFKYCIISTSNERKTNFEMRTKTIYATLDTETVGGIDTPKGAYNYGIVIHDREGTILATQNLLVAEYYDEIKNDDYAKKNFDLYKQYIEEGKVSVVATEDEAISILKNLCKYYDVKYVMAFNSGFDMCKTRCRELLEDFEFIDLWLMALQTLTHYKKFSTFCNNFGMKNKKGNCLTNAETMYAYVTNTPDYEEEHTALADSLIEMEIFKACLKTHKKFTKNAHCWDCKENKKFPK